MTSPAPSPSSSPGDTLLLQDGTYSPVSIDCTAYRNGTAGNPITVKAEHERQAWIQGVPGTNGLGIGNCSYWIFEGLHVSNADGSLANDYGQVVVVTKSDHLVIRRFLLHNPNRYGSNHVLDLEQDVTNSLIEDNELYAFHRHGIIVTMTEGQHVASQNNVIRRNYAHSRWQADGPGYSSNVGGRGDVCFLAYPGAYNIFENNLCEVSGQSGFTVFGPGGWPHGNQFFGNIAVDSGEGGGGTYSYDPYQGVDPAETYFEHHVTLESSGIGFGDPVNSRCHHCMVLGGPGKGYFGGIMAYRGASPHAPELLQREFAGRQHAGYDVWRSRGVWDLRHERLGLGLRQQLEQRQWRLLPTPRRPPHHQLDVYRPPTRHLQSLDSRQFAHEAGREERC